MGGGTSPHVILLAACVFFSAAYAQARTHRSQSWADTQFTKAEAQRETLNGHDEQARTRHEYQTVIASYRRIVLEAPTSSKADASAFAVAQLTAEMGRHFKDDMALYSAVREFKYLRREYPGSKHRIEALLAIGEIYKNDLGDDSDARAAFEELLRNYPRSHYAAEAQAELKASTEQASAGKDEADRGKMPPSEFRGHESKDGSNGDSEQATEQASSDASSSEKPVRVKDVRYWSMPDYTRVSIELEQDVQFESQRIDHPDRIFFDLKNAHLASHLAGQTFDIDDGLVKKVRVAQYKPGRARVVIETASRAAYNASLVLNPPRLIIDVHNDDVHSSNVHSSNVRSEDVRRDSTPQKTTVETVSTRNAHTDEAEPVDDSAQRSILPGVPKSPRKVVVEADDEDTPVANASDEDALKLSTKTSKTAQRRVRKDALVATRKTREAQPTSDGDRSLIRALGLKIGKIVIDPGHGGHDTGTIGPNGFYEKDLVLDVSKRLGKLLESRLGAEVAFTRHDDTFIPLETRTAMANQEQADLFVSVHANSSRDQDARGVETYYLNFTSSPEALEVAARENAASDKSIHELQDLVKKIALKEKIEESREFASDVQQSLHSGLASKSPGIRDRGVKKAPFVVLIGANMPSILAEISFISNPGDEKRLRSPEYRQRIAESLYRGISRYVGGLSGVKVASRMEKASGE
jgi:N-acetylmuramoyl-L-alanine amidase